MRTSAPIFFLAELVRARSRIGSKYSTPPHALSRSSEPVSTLSSLPSPTTLSKVGLAADYLSVCSRMAAAWSWTSKVHSIR